MTDFQKAHAAAQCACLIFKIFTNFLGFFLGEPAFCPLLGVTRRLRAKKSSFTLLLIVILSSLLFLYHHYNFVIYKSGRGKLLTFSLLKFSVPLASFISINILTALFNLLTTFLHPSHSITAQDLQF